MKDAPPLGILAIIVLLAIIALNTGHLQQAHVDPYPSTHTVIPCPDTTDDGYYDPPQGFCDDPNTTD